MHWTIDRSIHQSIAMYKQAAINSSINPSIHESIQLSIHQSIQLSIHESIDPWIHESVRESYHTTGAFRMLLNLASDAWKLWTLACMPILARGVVSAYQRVQLITDENISSSHALICCMFRLCTTATIWANFEQICVEWGGSRSHLPFLVTFS